MKVSKRPYDPGPAAWNEILDPPDVYPILEENKKADIVIIGAGFAGLSAARRLSQLDPKAKIVLLEARTIAEGPAGRNSGFMIDLPHNLASKDYAGTQDHDRLQTRLNREAIKFAHQAADELGMTDEAFTISGKINAAATQQGAAHNADYAAHLNALNEEHTLLDQHEMEKICGSSYYESGLFTPGTAMLQPALYIRNLAKGVSHNGIDVFENSPAIELTRQSACWIVKTPTGQVSTPTVILTTNGHVESFGYFERRLIHIYLYASMTENLSKDALKDLSGQTRWAFTPADPMGTTVRKISGTGGDRIIVRNRFTWAPNRTVSPSKLKSIGRVHDRSFQQRFPNLDGAKMEYRWGGLLCLSWNNVPAFGEMEDGLYAACCQNGLGTAMGTLSGKLIAEYVSGKSSDSLAHLQSLAKPKKLPPEPFATIGANVTMRWGEWKAGKEM